MRVDYEIDNRFIQESFAAMPRPWKRKWQIQFLLSAIISFALASMMMVALDLVGPMLLGWLFAAICVGFAALRYRTPTVSVDPNTRQYVEVNNGALTLGGDTGWTRHSWSIINDVRETAQLIQASIGREPRLLTIPKAAFRTSTDATAMFDAMQKFRANSRKDPVALVPSALDSEALLEIDYPGRDPFNRDVRFKAWLIFGLMLALAIWISLASEFLRYPVGSLAFILALMLVGLSFSCLVRRIAGRHIPLPGVDRLVLTDVGIRFASNLLEHLVAWQDIAGASTDGRYVHIWSTNGHAIHSVPREAVSESSIASLFEIVAENAAEVREAPEAHEPQSEEPTLDALQEEFSSAIRIEKVLSLTVYPLLLIGLGVVWFIVLKMTANGWQQGSEAVHRVTLNVGYWVLPAIPLAIISFALICYVIWRIALGSAFTNWVRYGSLVYGGDVRQKLLICLCFCAAFAAVLVPLGLDCYVDVTPQRLRINRFLTIGSAEYAFDRIASISDESFDFEDRKIPAYRIEFDDGASWSSQGWIKDVNPYQTAQHREIVEYVSRQSNVEIR